MANDTNKTPDPFSQLIRDKGELATKVQRLEELLASSRAQTENFLQQKLKAEAEREKAEAHAYEMEGVEAERDELESICADAEEEIAALKDATVYSLHDTKAALRRLFQDGCPACKVVNGHVCDCGMQQLEEALGVDWR